MDRKRTGLMRTGASKLWVAVIWSDETPAARGSSVCGTVEALAKELPGSRLGWGGNVV